MLTEDSNMDDEHEMCQNCKRDIPVSNYRTHTLHCVRIVTSCPDCGDPVSRDLMDSHQQQFHSPRECSMCGTTVQAVKLHSHQKSQCLNRKVTCKYCQVQKIFSQMEEHEPLCGNKTKSCPSCTSFVALKDFETHVKKHKEEGSKPASNTSKDKVNKLPRNPNGLSSQSTDALTMLPCEFCEAMVPMYKLLEHQAECVNPSNIRSGSGITRSQSMYTSKVSSNVRKKPLDPEIHRRNSEQHQDDNYLPCEFCGQSFISEYIMRHQMKCDKNPHPVNYSPSTRRSSSYLTPSSSFRQTRACTEDRQLYSPISSVYRHRRGESVSRQNSFSSRNYFSSQHRSSIYSSSTSISSAVAARRASVFDGYSGFALYSSISQGLDEITYGGRLSRRNSITESTYSRGNDSYTLPTLLALQSTTPTTPTSPRSSEKTSSERRSSLIQKDSDSKKIVRNVSFTGKDPDIINEPKKKSDKSEKTEKSERKEKKKSEKKKKNRLSNGHLLDEVNDKLKILEAQQQRQVEEKGEEECKPFLDMKEEKQERCPSPLPPSIDQTIEETKNIVSNNGFKVVEEPKSETLKDVTNEIERRPRRENGGSKAGSKRNSLDSKTVQGLAQDLAAECAKAYALMESSLSKLSNDFAPFGLTSKQKKSSRKTRAPPLK